MVSIIVLSVTSTSLVWLFFYLLQQRKHSNEIRTIEKEHSDQIRASDKESSEKIVDLIKNNAKESIELYNKGFLDSEQKWGITVQTIPFTEEIDIKMFFSNKKTLKVGYRQLLTLKGIQIPLYPIFVEEFTAETLNEENINKVILLITDILITFYSPVPIPANAFDNLNKIGAFLNDLLIKKASKNWFPKFGQGNSKNKND